MEKANIPISQVSGETSGHNTNHQSNANNSNSLSHNKTTKEVKADFLPQVKYVVPVASGKGGVGKSTVCVNLALSLQKKGYKVGIMDADVYGPSIPKLLGVTERPKSFNNIILPVEKHGLRIISMAFFVDQNEAVIWRGPLLHKMIHDFLGAVGWGELDFLLVDLPPGTGDIQLSLCQTIPLTGAVIVSTPQEVAWEVAKKAILMFDKLNVPIAGVVENMSYFICSHCNNKEYIFGNKGAKIAAESLEIPFLGSLPLDTFTREYSDKGKPIVISQPESNISSAFDYLTNELIKSINDILEKSVQKAIPINVSVSDKAEIRIAWSDGSVDIFHSKMLRYSCPCAQCIDEISRERTIDYNKIPDDIKAVAFNPVGSYALQIIWSDGHSTGLYGYKLLKSLNKN